MGTLLFFAVGMGWINSNITALLAILAPILCLALIAFVCFLVIRIAGRLISGRVVMTGR